MKKILIILIILVLAILTGWFLLRGGEAPLVGTIMDGLPFGSGENTQLTTNDQQPTTDGTETNELGTSSGNLFRISDVPVAGAVAINRQGLTFIRYVDRATGHIYEVDAATRNKRKITNQTLPKIYEAYFRPDGNAILLRYLKNNSDVVENVSLNLTLSTSSSTLYTIASTLLRGDISAVSVSSAGALFYALSDTSSIVTSAFNGSGLRTLLNSPFTDWKLTSSGNGVVLSTKTSSGTPGYAYTLTASNGALNKILGPLNGLIVTPNNAGNRVLYSYVENGAKFFAKNLTSGSISEILPATLAEKCVWSTKYIDEVYCGAPVGVVGNNEPDNWYKGVTHFSDRLWRFDTATQIAELLAEPKVDINIDLDIYQPKLSPNEDYLIFINKTDLSLWVLKLD